MPRISVPITSLSGFPGSIGAGYVFVVILVRGIPPSSLPNPPRRRIALRPSFGCVELHLLCLCNCCKVDNACLKSDLCRIGIVSEPILFERIHQLLPQSSISSGVKCGCGFRPQGHPFGDTFLRFDRCQSCSCGTFRLV